MNGTIEGLGGAPPAAKIVEKGEDVVASGALLSSGRVAGLERAARCAGEAFGYEEAAPMSRQVQPSGWLGWLSASIVARVGRLVPGAR